MGDTDGAAFGEPAKIRVYENTYHLTPTDQQKFKKSMAEKIMSGVLQEKMQDSVFNERDKKGRLKWQFDPQDDTSEIVREILDECQKRVVAQMRADNNDQPPRYKVIFQCSIGEDRNQLVRFSSRCLWDIQNGGDTCASSTWANSRVYAVVTCFALYYE